MGEKLVTSPKPVRSLLAADAFLLGYLCVLALSVALLAPNVEVELAIVIVATLIVFVASLTRGRAGELVHSFAPILYVVACFELTAAAGGLNPLRGDPMLSWIDNGPLHPIAAGWRGFVATSAGYLLLPTSGPRVSREEADALLGGGLIARNARTFLALVKRNRWDAFPSGHTSLLLNRRTLHLEHEQRPYVRHAHAT